MLTWNKLGAVPPGEVEIKNGVRQFTLTGLANASLDMDRHCLYPAAAPVVQSGTRGFRTGRGDCTSSAWQDLLAEQASRNTILANTQTSVPGSSWDLVVTNNREAVALLAQPAGAYAILSTDHTNQQLPVPGTSPAPTKKKESNTALIIGGGVIGGLLGLAAGGPVGAALGGAAGAFAGSLPD